MKAGDLREPITILKRTVTTDSEGNRPKAWPTLADCMAKVTDVSGRDFYQAQAQQALDIVTFRIRWRDDVEAAYLLDRSSIRIRHQRQDYEVVHLNRLGQKRDFMILKARSLQMAGD